MNSPYPPPDETPVPELNTPDLGAQVLDENSPEFKEQEAKATVIMEVVLPLFLEAGRSVMSSSGDAPERVANLLVSLQNSAKEAEEGPDGFWTAAAEICRAVFLDQQDPVELAKRTEELDKREGFAWKTLCVLCYLGASFHAHALPRLSITLHMAVAEYIHRHTSYNQAVYELRLMPWFTWFWYRTFENSKFRFYAPSFVEMDLSDAMKGPPGVRLQRVLRAIAFGLWEPIPEKGREWFTSASPDYTPMAYNSLLPDNLSANSK